jgi:hypothetical protein
MSTVQFFTVLSMESGVDIDVEIEFWHTPAERETWGFDGGTPAVPESWDDVEVVRLAYRDEYITKQLTESELKQVHEKIHEHLQYLKEKNEECYDRD